MKEGNMADATMEDRRPHALVVRLPAGISAIIADLAQREFRSMSGQVIELVQEALDMRVAVQEKPGKAKAPTSPRRATGINY
jgi:hypothetical protein